MKSLILILALLPICAACSGSITPAADNGILNVLDLGAKGDGKTLDTPAIQKAIDTASANGGGQVLLPAGKTFLSGSLTLKSNVDLHLANGAILKGSPNWRDYLPAGSFIFAKNAANISITGNGTIDGNDAAIWQKLADEEANGNINTPNWWPNSFIGDYWPFDKKPGDPDKTGGRPMMLILLACDNVHLQNITLRAAPSWTLHLVGCHDVAVSDISIRNSWEVANNDGIDVDHCRNVRITNSLIDCADDCIVIKNTPNFESYGDCEQITVTGCTLHSRSAALKVDEIYTGTARDIIFDACTISHSNRGLAIQLRDAGNIENVIFSNIVVETEFQPHKWWGAGEPIQVTNFPRTPETKLGHVKNIRFSNIIARGQNGIIIQGWPGNPIDDITLDNVTLDLIPAKPTEGGFEDFRPQGIFKGVFQSKLPGLYIRETHNCAIRNSRINWSAPDNNQYGPSIDRDQSKDLQLQNLTTNPSTAKQ
jgi:polygalacturonase